MTANHAQARIWEPLFDCISTVSRRYSDGILTVYIELQLNRYQAVVAYRSTGARIIQLSVFVMEFELSGRKVQVIDCQGKVLHSPVNWRMQR